MSLRENGETKFKKERQQGNYNIEELKLFYNFWKFFVTLFFGTALGTFLSWYINYKEVQIKEHETDRKALENYFNYTMKGDVYDRLKLSIYFSSVLADKKLRELWKEYERRQNELLDESFSVARKLREINDQLQDQNLTIERCKSLVDQLLDEKHKSLTLSECKKKLADEKDKYERRSKTLAKLTDQLKIEVGQINTQTGAPQISPVEQVISELQRKTLGGDSSKYTDFDIFVCQENKSDPRAANLLSRVVDVFNKEDTGVGRLRAKLWGAYDEISYEKLKGKTTLIFDKDHPEFGQKDRVEELLGRVNELPDISLSDNEGVRSEWLISIVLCPY